ncbi:MAG TPA: hypothetical protein EYG39_10270, partial [Rhodothermales bacterium]|nr:hypothetical protein [Rhodothermales bacterium]
MGRRGALARAAGAAGRAHGAVPRGPAPLPLVAPAPVNLFGDLEGLKGEQLATAGLRLLVLRSPSCRAALVKLLDEASSHGPLVTDSHFSCYTEYATDDDDHGRGRIDLTVETDDAVVGIEVKLGAAFQAGQPGKYLAELGRVARHLSAIRRRPVRPVLAVVAPENRRAETGRAMDARALFIAWEDLVEALEGAAGGDPFVSVLTAEYARYLRDRIGFLPGFLRWARSLTNAWEPGGTAYQRQFLRALWSELPGEGGRLGSGESWAGYYFSPDGSDGPRSWIGFLSTSRAGQAGGAAVLVIASPRADVPD